MSTNKKLEVLLRENPQYNIYVYRVIYEESFIPILHTVKYETFYNKEINEITWCENTCDIYTLNLDDIYLQPFLDKSSYLLFARNKKAYILSVFESMKVEEKLVCVS